MINLIVVLGKIGASIAIANSLYERAAIAPFSSTGTPLTVDKVRPVGGPISTMVSIQQFERRDSSDERKTRRKYGRTKLNVRDKNRVFPDGDRKPLPLVSGGN